MVNIGIESGDQDILDAHKEGVTLGDIRRDVTALYQSGLHVKGLFMIGFPGETARSIEKTIEFACSLPLKDANVTAFTPYPGAPITASIDSLGSFEQNWDQMDCEHFVFTPNSFPNKSALQGWYRRFIKQFYTRPFAKKMYRSMLWQSPHSYWRLLKSAPAFLRYRKQLLQSPRHPQR
jgi:radical SAM superfamily enzyme YgiQ (UPF0313 family)